MEDLELEEVACLMKGRNLEVGAETKDVERQVPKIDL
jgi:hypothetical protein